MMPDRQRQTEKSGAFIAEDVPAQVQEDVRFSEGEKSVQPPTSGPDSSLDQPARTQKKEKEKTRSGSDGPFWIGVFDENLRRSLRLYLAQSPRK